MFSCTYCYAARDPLHSFPTRRSSDLHTAEAASALRSRKTERAAKEKPTPISHIFLSTCCAWHPNSPPRPGEIRNAHVSTPVTCITRNPKLTSTPPDITQEVPESENRP